VTGGTGSTTGERRARGWLSSPSALGLICVVALGAALRIPGLAGKSFWLDENYTMLLLDNGFGDMLGEVERTEATPPLYYLLAWGWTRIFGLGEVGVRSLSVLLGIALIVVAWLVARELFSRRAALIAAALIACNPFLIWYSQEARAYELLALGSGLSLLFLLRARAGKPNSLALWSASSVLVLLSHYVGALLVAVEAAWLLVGLPDRRRAVAAAIAPIVAVGAALLPLIDAQGPTQKTGWVDNTPLGSRLGDGWSNLLGGGALGAGAERFVAAVVSAELLTGVVLLIARGTPEQRRGAQTLAVISGGALVLGLLLALGGWDYVLDRNLIWLVLPVLAVAAAGLGLRSAKVIGTAIAILICCLSAVVAISGSDEAKNGEDWAAAAEAIGPPDEARLIVTGDGYGFRGLRVYTDAQPPAGGEPPLVEEVVVVDSRGADRNPTPPDPRLDLIEEVENEHFSLVRFRSKEPVRLAPQWIANRLQADRRYVLVQR
jgi:mannosyltransferase